MIMHDMDSLYPTHDWKFTRLITLHRFALAILYFSLMFSTGTALAQRRGGFAPERGVYKARVQPQWLTNNTQFWYVNDLRGGTKEFILVDAEKGTRQRAFDHEKLAAALSKASGEEYKADKLPFSRIEFENGSTLKFEVSGKAWRCDLNSYECVATPTNSGSASLLQNNSSDLLVAESSDEEIEDSDARASSFDEPQSPQEQTSTNQPARGRGQRRGGFGGD
jgi:hypothetical protein